ncbi:hypothetical protein FZEAL_4836 [Fusarium zealandicum]|uniref:Major facilitator superfamily (MFS) profile domain-containing protein n=1 Tax=Fusarium zealandicum TaxID=1053134 RepID=A0A8H4ULP8_9HYPO|nr:hypothetical protein FZEAL_4836 [Fusarium zealandicum]
MSLYHDRQEPTKPGRLAPDHIELSSTTWQSVSQEEESTRYDPGESVARSASNASSTSDVKSQLPLGQALRLYPKIARYCLAMAIPVIGWGYDLVIVGAMTGIESFQRDYGTVFKGKQIIPGNWLSLWLALPPAGSAIGAVVGGWIQDRIGRKLSLMAGTLTSAIAISCIFFSHMAESQELKRAVFTAGLTIQGFSVGIIKTTCLTWVSENAPTALRGPAMAMFPIFTLVGQLIGSIVAYLVNSVDSQSAYLGAFASQWVIALGPFILSCIMPDSPSYLIRKGQEEKAMRSTTRLFAPNINPHSALEKIRSTVEEEKALQSSASYWACFKGTNLRRTLIVVLANVLPALFGLDLLSNASIFLQSIGMASGPSLLITIFGIVAGMIANAGGFWILSRVGRRSMTIVSIAAAGILWGSMGVTGFWSSSTLAWVAAGLMIAVIMVCGLGCWPAGYAIMGETSSLQLRAPTQGVGVVASQGSSITLAVVLPLLFNPDKAALGAKTGFLYCGLCTIGVVVSWFCLPEMKDRSMVEIDHMFEMRLPTRKFKHWKMEIHEAQEVSPLSGGTRGGV